MNKVIFTAATLFVAAVVSLSAQAPAGPKGTALRPKGPALRGKASRSIQSHAWIERSSGRVRCPSLPARTARPTFWIPVLIFP